METPVPSQPSPGMLVESLGALSPRVVPQPDREADVDALVDSMLEPARAALGAPTGGLGEALAAAGAALGGLQRLLEGGEA